MLYVIFFFGMILLQKEEREKTRKDPYGTKCEKEMKHLYTLLYINVPLSQKRKSKNERKQRM